MSDTVQGYRDLKEYQRVKRLLFGVLCPKCREEQPKRNATILEPGRICKVHKPWFRDPRPEPTSEEHDAKMREHGYFAEAGESDRGK